MALDLQNRLLLASPDELRQGLHRLSRVPWASLRNAGVTIVRTAVDMPTALGDRLANECLMTRDLYGTLERASVIAIGGIVSPSGMLTLAGGSVSNTMLDLNSLVVRKFASQSQMSDEDGINRHRAEAHWLSRQSSSLFPATRIEVDQPKAVQYSLEFVPRYTLGELILQERLFPIDVVRHLELVLEILDDEVYHAEAPRAQQSYLSIVRRRLSYFISQRVDLRPRLERWRREGVRVNGLQCRPLDVALQQLESLAIFSPIVYPKPGQGCHGDLIAEDILADGDLQLPPVLVDPNPRNSSRLIDVGKLVMTFRFHYDLMLRDLFEVHIFGGEGLDQVDLTFPSVTARRYSFNEEVDSLLAVSPLIERLLSFPNQRVSRLAIDAQAALHVIAISTFHGVHHQQIDRALGFLASGMAGLEESLRGLEFLA